jgi:hypothetical protein
MESSSTALSFYMRQAAFSHIKRRVFFLFFALFFQNNFLYPLTVRENETESYNKIIAYLDGNKISYTKHPLLKNYGGLGTSISVKIEGENAGNALVFAFPLCDFNTGIIGDISALSGKTQNEIVIYLLADIFPNDDISNSNAVKNKYSVMELGDYLEGNQQGVYNDSPYKNYLLYLLNLKNDDVSVKIMDGGNSPLFPVKSFSRELQKNKLNFSFNNDKSLTIKTSGVSEIVSIILDTAQDFNYSEGEYDYYVFKFKNMVLYATGRLLLVFSLLSLLIITIAVYFLTLKIKFKFLKLSIRVLAPLLFAYCALMFTFKLLAVNDADVPEPERGISEFTGSGSNTGNNEYVKIRERQYLERLITNFEVSGSDEIYAMEVIFVFDGEFIAGAGYDADIIPFVYDSPIPYTITGECIYFPPLYYPQRGFSFEIALPLTLKGEWNVVVKK